MSAISCKNFSDIYSKNNIPKNISLIASHYIQNPLLLAIKPDDDGSPREMQMLSGIS